MSSSAIVEVCVLSPTCKVKYKNCCSTSTENFNRLSMMSPPSITGLVFLARQKEEGNIRAVGNDKMEAQYQNIMCRNIFILSTRLHLAVHIPLC